ncbi:hypothetical protein TIFTF001_003150 [Ficus carica]|uniref:Uncharacterized protein n=1 Tax=Ficus carica TaxID=3494 RepID=A0AA88CVD1_FICCA|nr:hypothetical protein TIFTF001_003150 [Ficus carica]
MEHGEDGIGRIGDGAHLGFEVPRIGWSGRSRRRCGCRRNRRSGVRRRNQSLELRSPSTLGISS